MANLFSVNVGCDDDGSVSLDFVRAGSVSFVGKLSPVEAKRLLAALDAALESCGRERLIDAPLVAASSRQLPLGPEDR